VDQKRPVDVQNGANDPELPPARQPEADAGQPIKFVGVQRALRRAIRVARSSALQSDASLFADELVVRALIDILKAPPAACVVDEDVVEIGLVRANIVKKLG